MNTKLAVLLSVFCFLGCSTISKQSETSLPNFAHGNVDRVPSSSGSAFARYSESLGYKIYYANLHSHHYMEHKGPLLQPSGQCPHMRNFSQDDGRPCRSDANGISQIVSIPTENRLDYFNAYCDYAREKGAIDILYVTPHSKNNSDSDTDTRLKGYEERHKLLGAINEKYQGQFLCGLGQEASSISAGNHVNIFGHFKIADAEDTHPFYFKTGDFKSFYSEVKRRRDAGENIVLQFNHPDVGGDLYMGSLNVAAETDPAKAKKLKKKLKEALNDYGLDDFSPMICGLPKGKELESCEGKGFEAATPELIKQTYQNILANGGDAYSLIEVTETTGYDYNSKTYGATTNTGENFYPVQNRTDRTKKPTQGLLAYIFFLNMGFKISPTANQDNHYMNPGSALASRTGVLARSLSEDDVLDALKNRRTFASEDKNAKVLISARAGNERAIMGEDLRMKGDNLVLYVGYDDGDETDPADIRVYSYAEGEDLKLVGGGLYGAIRTIQFTDNGNGSLKAELPNGEKAPADLIDGITPGSVKGLKIPVKSGRTILFVEITQRDQDKIWSAPIFVNAE